MTKSTFDSTCNNYNKRKWESQNCKRRTNFGHFYNSVHFHLGAELVKWLQFRVVNVIQTGILRLAVFLWTIFMEPCYTARSLRSRESQRVSWMYYVRFCYTLGWRAILNEWRAAPFSFSLYYMCFHLIKTWQHLNGRSKCVVYYN